MTDLLPLILAGEVVITGIAIYLCWMLLDILDQLKKINRKLIRILKLLKKIVATVTAVTVKTDAATYNHADTVNITGTVMIDTVPQSGTTVNLKIVDSAGTEADLADVTTAADGTFTAAWIIPSTAASGICALTATALGVTATATFTLQQ